MSIFFHLGHQKIFSNQENH